MEGHDYFAGVPEQEEVPEEEAAPASASGVLGVKYKIKETKDFWLTSEFWLTVTAILADLGGVIPTKYAIYVATAYVIARGIAKHGSQHVEAEVIPPQ